MNDFKRFVHALGLPLDPNRKVTPKLLSDYMRRIKGTPEETLIEDVMLRSLMKARYATDNAGHFGLAFKHYTHFTSPIRRYPDLVVHRLLKEYQNGFDQSTRAARLRRLDRIAKWSSEREVVATEAERESIKLKKIEYMERHLGDEFEGVVSGVVPFGIFVEIIDLLVEGLVHISDLDDDYYVHDEAHYQLTGTASGHTYRLGDNVRVKVVRVDKNERVLDFILA
jgi:ribonuclease R